MGDEILAKDFGMVLGSASAIFATGIRKLGHQVTFVSQVGADQFGDFCVHELRAAGVSTKHVSRRDDLKTGVTVSLSGTRDRALVTYLGAIADFSVDRVPLSVFKNCDHLHMTSFFLQEAMRPSFAKLFRAARDRGLTTSFDPNSDPSGKWRADIRDVIEQSDVLFLNEREALQFTGATTVRSAAQTLGQQTKCAVIKLGKRGALAVKDRKLFAGPAFEIKAVDTTGAGDSFDAGFISAFLNGSAIEHCLRVANACGAMSALKVGGTEGQPDKKILARFLQAHC